MWLGERCQSIAQSYQCKQRIESWDSFPHLPSQNSIYVPSWLLLGTRSFSNVHFLIQKAFCWFPAFAGFRFLSWSIFENMETLENFHKFIFRGIKTIYLISTTFLRILCVQDTILKLLLKVTKQNLPLKLESSFACYWSKNGTYIINLLVFSRFLVTVTVNNGCFLI